MYIDYFEIIVANTKISTVELSLCCVKYVLIFDDIVASRSLPPHMRSVDHFSGLFDVLLQLFNLNALYGIAGANTDVLWQRIGLPESTLYRRLQEYQIAREKFKSGV